MIMLKRICFPLIIMLMMAGAVTSQRVAIVDINSILQSLPDYKSAEASLDKVASEWRQEISKEYDKIKSMYNKYQAEQVLLSDEVKKQREDEIVAKETEVRELQRRRFGAEGDLFKKRQELVSPVQDKVFTAIEDYAYDRGYDLILDKSGNAGILYTSDEYDKTEDIKKRLRID